MTNTMCAVGAKRIRWALTAALLVVGAGVHAQTPATATATPLLAKPLAGLQGKEGVMLTVDYPPGVASANP